MTPVDGEVLHASCVRWLDRGILIRGRSGAGKSALVLRLLDAGAWLVADDLVRVSVRGGLLHGEGLEPRGRVEIRGLGIYCLPSLPGCRLDLAVRATPARRGERLPEPRTTAICGASLAEAVIDPASATAVARLRMLLFAARVA